LIVLVFYDLSYGLENVFFFWLITFVTINRLFKIVKYLAVFMLYKPSGFLICIKKLYLWTQIGITAIDMLCLFFPQMSFKAYNIRSCKAAQNTAFFQEETLSIILLYCSHWSLVCDFSGLQIFTVL
jgi:hypothetical protein